MVKVVNFSTMRHLIIWTILVTLVIVSAENGTLEDSENEYWTSTINVTYFDKKIGQWKSEKNESGR